MPNRHLPTARKDELVIREVEEETLVYDYRTSKAFCLNQTASLIWKRCNGRNEPAAIARLLEKEFEAPVPEEIVWLAIKQLTKDDLLEEQPSISKLADGMSRREIMRRIGLSTAIALPVVVSLVAPSPAMAASGCFCVSPGDCLTQTACPSTNNCNGFGLCAP